MIIFDKEAFLKNESYISFDIAMRENSHGYRNHYKTAFDKIRHHEREFLYFILMNKNIRKEQQWDEIALRKLILLEE